MTQNTTAALATIDGATKSTSSTAKRLAKMTGAAVLSFGLVGTFAMPAYATAPETEGLPDGFTANGAAVQSLATASVDAPVEAVVPVSGDVDEAVLAQEAADKAAEEAAEAAATSAASQTPQTGKDVPAGAGAQGIVSAALAQLGQYQDCTALVERSLRAIGIPAGDLGTQPYEYTGLGGTLVTSGDYAPGDVLIWSGRHVAVYIGNGQAVHGGFGGNQTVVASAFLDGAPSAVVRF